MLTLPTDTRDLDLGKPLPVALAPHVMLAAPELNDVNLLGTT
ncbi:hypothetical protein CCP4SC76_7440004 [Gammaproteobacteria bacterium]